jgi:hypothetical protein
MARVARQAPRLGIGGVASYSWTRITSIVSSAVLWALVVIEGRRAGMKHRWAPIAANLVVGVSLGLPLFLYMREQRLVRAAGGTARSGV